MDTLMEVSICTLILSLGGSSLCPGLKLDRLLRVVLWSQDNALMQTALLQFGGSGREAIMGVTDAMA